MDSSQGIVEVGLDIFQHVVHFVDAGRGGHVKFRLAFSLRGNDTSLIRLPGASLKLDKLSFEAVLQRRPGRAGCSQGRKKQLGKSLTRARPSGQRRERVREVPSLLTILQQTYAPPSLSSLCEQSARPVRRWRSALKRSLSSSRETNEARIVSSQAACEAKLAIATSAKTDEMNDALKNVRADLDDVVVRVLFLELRMRQQGNTGFLENR